MWTWWYYKDLYMLWNNIFPKRKSTKSNFRTKLGDDHQDDVLLLLSANILPDVEKLSDNLKKYVFHKITDYF